MIDGINILTITLYGFVVGVVGTGLGGLISIFIKGTNKILSFLLGLTGGFMMFIVSFHLLPESFALGGLYITIFGIILGIILVILLEINMKNISKDPFVKSGLLLGLSIAVHNFPEGLALGSSFLTMSNLGPTLALAMLLHNIPEGLSMSIPLKVNKSKYTHIIFYSGLAGIPTGIGAFMGAYIGNISNSLLA